MIDDTATMSPIHIALASVAFLGYARAMDLTAPMIDSMGNNSLFLRWRQTSHLMPPAGVMGDPSGFMYDPTQDKYHLFYGWHTHHLGMGNMSWGHIMSKDLITWSDANGWQDDRSVALAPTGSNHSYDGLGIFSGSALPINLKGETDGTMTLFYTAAHYLPTYFYMPYEPGTESQNLATSTDGGRTWQRHEKNPVISKPPPWNITGFRDFFVEPMPFLDKILQAPEPRYYAIFGSGIKGVGSRMPLYSAPANDLTDWSFLGALWEPKIDESLGSLITTGTSGSNFEMSSLFTLKDEEGRDRYFVTVGVEYWDESKDASAQQTLFYEGTLSRRANGSAAFEPLYSGHLDYGTIYPFASFYDSKLHRRILFGTAQDDSVAKGLFAMTQQGHKNCFVLPREPFIHTVHGIVDHDGRLKHAGPLHLTKQSDETFTARTLGQRPAPDVVTGLRKGTEESVFNSRVFHKSRTLIQEASTHFEFSATMKDVTGRCGISVAMSPDGREYTKIYFDPSKYTVTIDRSSSSLIKEFTSTPVHGYFRPYFHRGSNGEAVMEPINWRIFLDGSLLEVFINDRFALTTRVFPSLESSNGIGIYTDADAKAFYENLHYWGGLASVWPDRPANSSTDLKWDTPEETNNYNFWAGY
ncbi:glycoside hydrolase family 32 protein [Myriangium duriaei CBS 260.36]|uniref:Glycoside hydrolase family 32 protein n=1 Tax=Myriangium duriaei CBS 260.36 TaxID=1168546 RepID=A0A9P4MFL5_9PEZI|nr:glycoside hydrolase family 32 protein [Myriangium duriaei CBS 260.36]